MIRRTLNFLSAEIRGLHMAAYVLAVSSLASSVLALLRDRLLAHIFGASATLDIYYTAFRIPDLLFVGTGALVSVYMLIPVLAKRTEDGQRDYFDTIFAAFCVATVVLSGVAMLLAPFLLKLLFPKVVDGSSLPTLVLLTRILLLQPILLGISNIFAAVTQSRHRYTLYALSPLLYNLGIIIGIVVLYPFFGLAGMVWGVVIGAAMHAGIQVPSLMRDGFLRRIPRIYNYRDVVMTVALSVPRALALSMSQLAFIGLTALAGLLSAGSIAIFMFAYNLQAVPISIIGASYSVAAFPSLAAALSCGKRAEFIAHIASAARLIVFWSLPATALMIVLRAHAVRIILGSGHFDWTDTKLTAAALAIFAVSLAFQSLALLFVRGFYAAGHTFVPFATATFSAIGAILLGVILIGVPHFDGVSSIGAAILRVQAISGRSVLLLVSAYAIAESLETIVLVMYFERKFNGFWAQVRRSWWESVFAALVCGAAAYGTLIVVGQITFSSTLVSVFLHGAAGGIVGMAAALLTYHLLGNSEYIDTMRVLHTRIRKTGLLRSLNLTDASEEHVQL